MKRFLLFAFSCLLAASAIYAADDAAESLPPNIGHSLRQLVAWHHAQPRVLSAAGRRMRLAAQLPGRIQRWQMNANVDSAVVKITLDGSVSAVEVRGSLVMLGLEILAEDHSIPGLGTLFSARLPLDQTEQVAALTGVRSVVLAPRPWKHIGKVTAGGLVDLGASAFGPTTDGRGVTVGVISDSFDVATLDTQGKPLVIHAADDIASGDLPGPGNPDGHTTAVAVLAEGEASDDTNLDEGRAMLQIIHDFAPGAALAFSTTGGTTETFAASVRALRTNAVAPCDIIVDDVTFPDEPMFSDGPAALAVYDVTHDATLPGHKVLYYAAAGNNGDLGYVADFNPVFAHTTVNGPFRGNLKIDQVPGALVLDGFHNFDPRPGKVTVGQKVKVSGSDAAVDLQWDSAPGQTGVTAADFNLLVFDKDGNYLPELSGTDKNIVLGNTLELIDLPAGENGATVIYQLAITCANRSLPGGATHLRYVVNTNGTFTAKFTGHDTPTIFGHAAAVGADAVAACVSGQSTPEHYSSLGPVTILFDRAGNPQPPEVRQQPTLAAVDGANNTFFGFDTDGDGFPNFYGTSAAAPAAAGCAAILLQVAGGSGSLTNEQARSLLQGSVAPHVGDVNLATRTDSPPGATTPTVTLAEVRDDMDFDGTKNFFRLSFAGADTQTLRKIVITLNQSGMTFDDSSAGASFGVGAVSGSLQQSDVTATVGSSYTDTNAEKFRNRLTLIFTPGAFGPGSSVSFGLGIAKLNNDYRGLDAIDWAMIGTQFKARLVGTDGKLNVSSSASDAARAEMSGYSPFDGFGLINLNRALISLNEDGPPSMPDSQVAATPDDLLLKTNDGQLLEITPTGQIVRSYDLPGVQGATVLANGTIVALCKGTTGPFLTLLDPSTGVTTTATYPGWQPPYGDYRAAEIASQGNRVFVIDAAVPQTNGKTASQLLCYDSVDAVWSAFGAPLDTSMVSNYYSLLAGLDGGIYATAMSFFVPNDPLEVYDPASLQLLRTVPQPQRPPNTNQPPTTVDQSGNVFEIIFTTGAHGASLPTVVRLAADGTVAATLDITQLDGQLEIGYSLGDLKVDRNGKIYVTTAGGIIVTSTALSTAQFYKMPASAGAGSFDRATLSLVNP